MADNYIENKYEQYQARKAAWQKSGMKKKKPATAHTSATGSGMQKTYLQSHVKRVVAVHDLSGAGRVSLMAVFLFFLQWEYRYVPYQRQSSRHIHNIRITRSST